MTATAIIKHLKQIFSEYGISKSLMNDGGLQFSVKCSVTWVIMVYKEMLF